MVIHYRTSLLDPTKQILLLKKLTNLVKMLVQGPLGLDLHIYQKPDHSRLFFILSNVDGGKKS